jgi:hypothetical protein
MIDVRKLLSAAIRRIIRPRIISALLINSPSGMGEDDAQSGGTRYRRAQHETVDGFRARAVADAKRRGERSIIFGEQRPGIIGTNKRGHPRCDFIG